MNRIMKGLKFRGWNKQQKRMHYPEIYNILNGLTLPGSECYDYSETASIYKEGYSELMQFTGLKDKNGLESKEVYGGDILYNSDRDEYQEVIYNEDEARWDVRYTHGEQRSLADAIGNLNVVVGNIYENSGLIK